MAITDTYSRVDSFSRYLLKRNGDLKEKSIHSWHLADDITASGIASASGIFDTLKIDGPTTAGYVLTTDADGWGTWQEVPNEDHSTLSSLEWSVAGHTIDADIIPTNSTFDIGSAAIPFADGRFTTLYGDGSHLTGISTVTNFISLTDTPSAYTNWAGSGVRVNDTETGLEFCPINQGGGGGGTTILGAGYSTTFTDSDLSSGVLTVTHNLRVKSNVVQVFDENFKMIVPDEVTLSTINSLFVDLSSFAPIAGTWYVVVTCGGGPNNYTGGYTHTQTVPSLSWTIPHNLDTEDVIVQVYDSADPNNAIEPQEITITDKNNVGVVFPSGVSGKAMVVTTNAVSVSAYGAHDQLDNLEWSTAGHTVDSSIVPIASGAVDVGSSDLPFASGYFKDLYVSGEVVGGIPTGGIIMWSGSIALIPTGWYLCDGNNGTPDLRDRFIVGAREDDSGVAKTTVTDGSTKTQSGASNLASHSHTFGACQRSGTPGYTNTCEGSNGSCTTLATATSGSGSVTYPPYYALALIMKG